MNILVLGVYYASNLGDAVICDCVAGLLQKQFPEAEISLLDLCGRQEFAPRKKRTRSEQRQIWIDDKKYKWITRLTPWDFAYRVKYGAASRKFPYIDAVCETPYDLAVFAGGQLFMDWLSPYVCRFVENFQKKQIPVLFLGCGTGPADSPKLRKKMEKALCSSCVRLISTRDDRETIEKWYTKGRKKVYSTYDAALRAAQQYGVSRKEEDVVGLGVMFAANLNPRRVQKFWIRLIREMEARKIRWQLFCNGDPDDAQFGEQILEQIAAAKDAPVRSVICPQSPKELVQVISGFKSILSFRLHSHIIAGSLGIPGVAVLWDEKLLYYHRKIGCEERCVTIGTPPGEVLRRLAQAEEEKSPVSLLLRQQEETAALLKNAVLREIDPECLVGRSQDEQRKGID